MSQSVYILTTYHATPVYHDYGHIRDAGTDRSADVTKCGLVLYDGGIRYHALLREDHASLFAKPCAKCFGAAAGPPEGTE